MWCARIHPEVQALPRGASPSSSDDGLASPFPRGPRASSAIRCSFCRWSSSRASGRLARCRRGRLGGARRRRPRARVGFVAASILALERARGSDRGPAHRLRLRATGRRPRVGDVPPLLDPGLPARRRVGCAPGPLRADLPEGRPWSAPRMACDRERVRGVARGSARPCARRPRAAGPAQRGIERSGSRKWSPACRRVLGTAVAVALVAARRAAPPLLRAAARRSQGPPPRCRGARRSRRPCVWLVFVTAGGDVATTPETIGRGARAARPARARGRSRLGTHASLRGI